MSIHTEFEISLCASCAWITDEEKDAVVETAVCVGACASFHWQLETTSRQPVDDTVRICNYKLSQELIAINYNF